MTDLEEAKSILAESDYNDLPKNVQNRIDKYRMEERIRTISDILETYKDLPDEVWRPSIKKYLRTCIGIYKK